jgi:hypothetical protein
MKTVEFIKDDGIHFQHYRVNTELRTNHSGTYVLASEANERIKVLETCCTIEAMIANPNVDSLIRQHEKTISEQHERIKLLEDALKDAIDSMDNDCDYEENHRSASEQARAALEVKP